MSIHSVCANACILRVLSQTQRFKWAMYRNKYLVSSYKIFHNVCGSSSKVICTDSRIQTYNYETEGSEKEHHQSFYLKENFLKENFNIVDSRYFKLVTVPSECNSLEQLLWTNEFKNVLTRTPFSYDVSVIGGAKDELQEANALCPHICKDTLSMYENSSVSKQLTSDFDVLFASNSEKKENTQGKATEEQLLHIINRLSHSLLNFFEEPHDFSIYHKNIVFQNNIKGVTVKGITAYAQTLYFMKFYGYLHFAKVKVEILKVTQHIEDGTVRVRWRVNGLPRHKLVIMLWKYKITNWQNLPKGETEWLDGFSVFSVGDDGLIYKHVCDKMIPDESQLLAKNTDLKSKVLGLLGLAPRGPTAGTLNTLLSHPRNQDFFSGKKLT